MKGSFQTIIIVIFILAAILGLLVFSGKVKIGADKTRGGSQGTVVLWGTVRLDSIALALDEFNNSNETFYVKYVQKYADTFDNDLLEALASGTGPDIFFLPNDLAYHYKNKISLISYDTFPIANFKREFASAGEVFLTSKGIMAFPIGVDPMVMYYNRSILDTNSIIYPPVYWDDFISLVPILTKKDQSKQIIQSTVALGQFSNVNNAKSILTTLFMQAGNPIVAEREGEFTSYLGEYNAKNNLASILAFFTDFADPLEEVYSWNKSLPNSRDMFSSENLAFYFGYASELPTLISRNPNQNFLVAPMPQIKNTNFKLTGSRVTGLAISSFSKNFVTAQEAASKIATSDFGIKYALSLGVVPIKLDSLNSTRPANAYSPTFYDSALFARSWLDPSPEHTDDIFRTIIDGVLSNNLTTGEAMLDLDDKMSLELIP